ncbi:MAG: hypothetical protein AB8H86_03500 [Polyangiales bacterium]
MRSLVLLGLIALVGACGDVVVTERNDAGRSDAGAIDGASARDAASPDATSADAGIRLDAALDAADEPDVPVSPDAGPMGPVDEIDLGTLIWLYPDISDWEITSELSVSFSGTNVCLEYDKKDVWPVVQIFETTDVVANAWVFAETRGQWYAATFEWMRPGQTCKAQAAVEGGHIKRNPFEADGWTPESGEELYFMVSGLIRNPTYSNVMERTNIVRATWP